MYRVLIQSNPRLLALERSFSCRYFTNAQHTKVNFTSNFSTVSCRMTAKKSIHVQKSLKNIQKSSKPGKSTSIAPPTNTSTYQSFAQVLALRQSPTILYQAESHRWFIVSCYLVGGFCILWAGINFRNQYLYPLEGTPPLISKIMAGICVCMLALGCWFLIRPRRLVQTINALPSASNPGSRALLLQIEAVAFLPGKQPSSLVVAAEDVTLSSPMFQSSAKISEAQEAEINRRKNELNERNKTRIMTAPFRQFNYFMWRGFRGAREFLSTEGFMYMRVNGKNGAWKINRNAAWSLEDGKSLDRLVKHNL